MADNLADELDSFRQEWLAEQTQRRQAAASTSVPIPRPVVHQQDELASTSPPVDGLEGLHLDDKVASVIKPKTAIELYHLAVVSEREGRLDDALRAYRAAFRMDPEVDNLYHRASLNPKSPSVSLVPLPLPTDDFKFERVLQLTPDYQPEKERRSVATVEDGTGKGSVDAETTHPSSTKFLLDSLLRSIASNPWTRPIEGLNGEGMLVEEGAVDKKLEQGDIIPADPSDVVFIAADPDRPFPISTVPHEVLLLILRSLALSSVIPPPKPRVIEAVLPPARGRRKVKTLKEEMQGLETDMGLCSEERDGWVNDVEALERFASTCRAARIITLDAGIWRDVCSRTYTSPHQISREEDYVQIVKELHVGDWRRGYIEHPRIRMDGVFIAVVTYLRRGESSNAWTSPTHLVTFYRYLRFYPTGLVLSLLTVDPPATVVKMLNPTLRVQGLTIGRWRLRGDEVECWGLEDPSVEENRRKYSFRMNCRLRSTARGRMNKLEIRALATENRTTFALDDVPIRPTKPFFFSKVASYAGEEM